jgi:hypothetical protein
MTTQATKTAPSAATPRTTQNYFSRKIGNTTFVVSVSFSEKTKESIDDKILRLVASEIQKGAGRPLDSGLLAYASEEVVQCG